MSLTCSFPSTAVLRRLSLPLVTALIWFVGPRLAAQTDSDDSDTVGNDEPVLLNPFTVTASSDVGYLAGSSLAGSRLDANLKDVASPTTAFTPEFMRDIGVDSTDDLAAFMLSTEYDFGEDAGGQNRINGDAKGLRMRGLPGGSLAVNFFNVGLRFDSFSLDRVDQSRGPNAILFGVGSPGGLINVTTKRALLSKQRTQLTLQAKSYNGWRAQLDYNQPLFKRRLALRVAAVGDREDDWKNYDYDHQERYFGTLKWRVADSTEFNIEAERGHIDKSSKRTFTAYDAYTPWRDAGMNISATPNAGLGISKLTGINWAVYDTASGQFWNMRNTTVSSTNVSADGDVIALNDFSVLPKETRVYGPGFSQTTDYNRISAYLTHTFNEHFSGELAAISLDQDRYVTDPPQGNSLFLKVDTNPTLPDGSANPNVGRTYLEGYPQINNTKKRDQAARLSLAYDHDLGWFGKHRLAGVYQYSTSTTDTLLTREQIIKNPFNANDPGHSQNRVWRRTYVDLGSPSEDIVMTDWRAADVAGVPIVGASAAESRLDGVETAFIPFSQGTRKFKDQHSTYIAMLQSTFWKDRLHTILGYNKEHLLNYASTPMRGDPLPGFNQGVIYAQLDDTPEYFDAENRSFSGVFHVTPWLSFAYNKSENTALPNTAGRLHSDTGRPPIPKGKSDDYGLRLDLLNHKLYFTATYFETTAAQDFDYFGILANDINPIWNSLYDQGVITGDVNDYLDDTTGTTFDSRSQGWEFELVGNITRRLRVFANYSDSKVRRTNIGSEMRAYIAANRDFWLANGSTPLSAPKGNVQTVADQVGVVDQLILTQFDLPQGGLPVGQIERKGNARLTYELPGDLLKGFTVGGGLRYQGPAVAAYILDTSGMAAPSVLYTPSKTFVDLNLTYRRKLNFFGNHVSWSLQLNVNNLFNNADLIPLKYSSAGELLNYRFNDPRTWKLTSTFSF